MQNFINLKTQVILTGVVISSILIVFSSCKKTQDDTPNSISIESPTEIEETSFYVNWMISTSDINSISIEVSLNDEFETIEKEVPVANLNQQSQIIDQVMGSTKYYYRVRVYLNDGSMILSDTKTVTTSYKTESVTITTSDGIRLAAKLKYLGSNNGKKPGIIFMHELMPFGNNWQKADVVTNLIAEGYVCLILDFRGHFSSDYVPLPTEYSQVEEFIYNVSKDLVASIEFMKSNDVVDGNKLALVGGSLGSIMAIAGNGYDEVVASVALSPYSVGIYSVFPDLIINSTLFIAAENNVNSQGVNFAQEATAMYNYSEEPKKLIIVPGSSEHGTNLLLESGITNEIKNWIIARMEN